MTHPHLDLEARSPLLQGAVKAARSVPTPFYIYDADAIEARVRSLRSVLPDSVEIHFAMKANPRSEILSLMATLGCGVDVASTRELEVALKAGMSPDRISFAGPGKSDSGIALAIRESIHLLILESEGQARRASNLARRAGKSLRVGLRINPREGIRGAGLVMGGGASALGIDEERMGEAIRLVHHLEGLDFRALHVFAGGQSLDVEAILTHHAAMADLMAGLARDHGIELETAVLGSGLGIPYFAKDRPLDLNRLGEGVTEIAGRFTARPGLEKTRLALEPGRFLVGEAGAYVCRVVDRKVSRGRMFVIVDGGMHQHLVAAGGMGAVVRRNFPLVALSPRPGDLETVDIAGPLCHPLDRLAIACSLPPLEEGDLIAVLQSGAYGFTASPRDFLSHPHAAEVWLRQGRIQLMNHQESS